MLTIVHNTLVPTPPHGLPEDPPEIHNTKSNMARTPQRQEKRQSRRIDKLQYKILKIMQTLSEPLFYGMNFHPNTDCDSKP